MKSKVFILIGSVLILFLIVEIYFRIFPVKFYAVNDPYQYTSTQGEMIFGRPFHHFTQIYPKELDLRGYYNKTNGIVNYFFNQFGARWKENKEQVLKSKKIMVLGDAFTAGFGLQYEDNFIYKLERLFDQSRKSYSFLNFSLPAADSMSNVEMLIKYLEDINPTRVLYGLYLNDLIKFSTSYIISGDYQTRDFLISNIKFFDFVRTRTVQYFDRKEKIEKLTDPKVFLETYYKDNMRAIEEMNLILKTRNISFTVIILPVIIDLKSKNFDPIYAGIANDFNKRGIAYVDLSKSLDNLNESDLWILPIDQHPNEVANEIFANSLFKSLSNWE